MSYTKKVWKDYPETTTPVNATNLNHMEDGIENVDSRVTTLESHTASDIPYGNTNVNAALNSINSSISTINSNISTTNANVNKRVKYVVKTMSATFSRGVASLGTLASLSSNAVSTSNLLDVSIISGAGTSSLSPEEWNVSNGTLYAGKTSSVSDITTKNLKITLYYD